MKKFYIFFLTVAVSSVRLMAQADSIELMGCLSAARNYAAIKPQMQVINEITELRISNADATNLPGMGAFGKASYQSDAVSIPGPNGMEVDLFQYSFGLEANQKLFDGGLANKSKELERAANTAEKNKVELELYQINNEVIRSFFTYNLLIEGKNVLLLKKDVLKIRADELESGIRNGIVRKNELDNIAAELMLVDQQILEVESKCLQLVNALGMLTGIEMSNSPTFYISDSLISFATAPRPELTYFESEKFRLQKMAELKSKQNLPKIYAFGQAGYSYPGLNMFENQPDYFYIVGAKLSWTLYDWKQVKREKTMILKQQEIIDTKLNDFDRNNSIQQENEQLEQEKLLSTIDIDKKLIQKRVEITRGSETSLKNGVITSAFYLDDLNDEIKSRIDLETHKIQYLNSIVKMALLKGILVQ